LCKTIGQEIVLHEDKKYYPDLDEVYPGVETLIQEEDAQPLTEPIIPPVKAKAFDILEKEIPDTFSFEFLGGLSQKQSLMHNVKTTLSSKP
jgi:116 kDa U5 small nuclear ribonucleoprotein component